MGNRAVETLIAFGRRWIAGKICRTCGHDVDNIAALTHCGDDCHRGQKYDAERVLSYGNSQAFEMVKATNHRWATDVALGRCIHHVKLGDDCRWCEELRVP